MCFVTYISFFATVSVSPLTPKRSCDCLLAVYRFWAAEMEMRQESIALDVPNKGGWKNTIKPIDNKQGTDSMAINRKKNTFLGLEKELWQDLYCCVIDLDQKCVASSYFGLSLAVTVAMTLSMG